MDQFNFTQKKISSAFELFSFPFSFQFFTRLAAVFAEEVGGFGSF
jgi:hypothetical protein